MSGAPILHHCLVLKRS